MTVEATAVTVFPDYLIQPGDVLDVRFFNTPELNEVTTVRPDGKISLPLVSAIRVTGLTPEQLAVKLTNDFAEQLLDPEINVMVKSFAGQKVYVGGEVEKPGVVEFSSPITVIEATIMAGGLTPDSDVKEILVIRRDKDNKPYAIRFNSGEAEADTALFAATLQAADVVYVPRSRIANVNLFIDQYIRGLLMFDGFRTSFGYNLDDPSSSSR
jgi:protein involved in polysaccharide export with SLBB domain